MFFFFCPHTKWLVSFENMNYLVKPKNYFCQADSVGRSYCSPIISAWQQGCGSCGGPPGTEGAGGRSGGGATIPPPCPLSHYSTTLHTTTLFHLVHHSTTLSTITLFHHLARDAKSGEPGDPVCTIFSPNYSIELVVILGQKGVFTLMLTHYQAASP